MNEQKAHADDTRNRADLYPMICAGPCTQQDMINLAKGMTPEARQQMVVEFGARVRATPAALRDTDLYRREYLCLHALHTVILYQDMGMPRDLSAII